MNWKATELTTGAAILAALGFLWTQLLDTPDGARMYPQLIIFTMGALTCVLMIRSYAGRTAPAGGAENWRFFKHAGRFVLSVAMFAVYLVGVGTLGYFTSSIVFLLALPVALGFRRGVMLGLTMAVFLGFVWAIFVLVFNRALPPEILGAALGG